MWRVGRQVAAGVLGAGLLLSAPITAGLAGPLAGLAWVVHLVTGGLLRDRLAGQADPDQWTAAGVGWSRLGNGRQAGRDSAVPGRLRRRPGGDRADRGAVGGLHSR